MGKKVVFVGTTRVGKTSIIHKFVNDQFTNSTSVSTQGAFFEKQVFINDHEIVMDIWDTAGQEKYHSLAPLYYRDAVAAVVVFDITNMMSFTIAKQWIAELKSSRGDNVTIVLVGNKSDLYHIRVVNPNEVKQYASVQGIHYAETSAKTGSNIDHLFKEIALKISVNSNSDLSDPVLLESGNSQKPCCL